MKLNNLVETVTVRTISETATEGVFEIEGLYTGYGITLGNALRRVLLSSLPGAAITGVKIKGAPHEFSTLPGIAEDIVEISLNLKKIRFKLHSEEPQNLTLKAKGIKEVSAADIEAPASVEIVNPETHIASLTTKNAELDMELTVEPGLGYVLAEAGKKEKLVIGAIAIDAIYSPVIKVNFTVENMRVGDRTDYNRLRIYLTTNGALSPSAALNQASQILQEHFGKVSGVEIKEPEVKAAQAKKKPKKRPAKKK